MKKKEMEGKIKGKQEGKERRWKLENKEREERGRKRWRLEKKGKEGNRKCIGKRGLRDGIGEGKNKTKQESTWKEQEKEMK